MACDNNQKRHPINVFFFIISYTPLIVAPANHQQRNPFHVIFIKHGCQDQPWIVTLEIQQHSQIRDWGLGSEKCVWYVARQQTGIKGDRREGILNLPPFSWLRAIYHRKHVNVPTTKKRTLFTRFLFQAWVSQFTPSCPLGQIHFSTWQQQRNTMQSVRWYVPYTHY